MRPRLLAIPLVIFGLALASPVRSQDPARTYNSLGELKASYAKQLVDLDRRRIADMANLASRQTGDEALATYRELFQIAMARDLYAEAESAAERFLKSPTGDPKDLALAALVNVIAQADRGAYDQSMADLTSFFKNAPVAADPNKRVEPATAIALGEAYIERLVRGGRYDIARNICEMIVARRPEPEIREHFSGRLARLKMIGEPAPAIVGRDIDGKPISLADLKGKVVLVDFWATWCPPCVAAIPNLKATQARYGKDGFVILGVNLDARRDGVGDADKATADVRQFLLNAGVSWPNLMVGAPSKDDPDTTYGVEEIPANFLIDRTGKIIHVEISGSDLDKAVMEAVKGSK
jgi:thiol-disulfide isomerase/thioredoxin